MASVALFQCCFIFVFCVFFFLHQALHNYRRRLQPKLINNFRFVGRRRCLLGRALFINYFLIAWAIAQLRAQYFFARSSVRILDILFGILVFWVFLSKVSPCVIGVSTLHVPRLGRGVFYWGSGPTKLNYPPFRAIVMMSHGQKCANWASAAFFLDFFFRNDEGSAKGRVATWIFKDVLRGENVELTVQIAEMKLNKFIGKI